MDSNVTIRAYHSADEDGLIATWNTSMWADPIDTAQWRTLYLLDPNFDPEECLVADAEGEIVGFVVGITPKTPGGPNATDNGEAWIVGFGVRPDHRRQGIGTALMRELRTRFADRGLTTIHVGPWVPTYVIPGLDVVAYADGIAFLEAIGGQAGGRPVSMKANLTNYGINQGVAELREKLGGEGITFRRATGEDILPLVAFMNEHFPHWRDYAMDSLRAVASGDSRAVSLLIALDGDEIIGFAQTNAERFGPFGVNEAYRGRGIGAVLLSDSLVAMRSRGFHSAWFLWTSDRTAKLYNQHGFEEIRRFQMMDLPVQEEPQA